MADAFLTTTDGVWFQPTEFTRGPWDPEACHGGPPTAMIARAAEHLVPDKRLVRLTVELSKPIPYAGFRVAAEVLRDGRSVATTRAILADGEGNPRASASGLHIAAQPMRDFPNYEPPHPAGVPEAATPGPFPFSWTRHGLVAFNGPGVQMSYPPGNDPAPGPTTVWMKTVPLLAGEEPSPFQRICPLADTGNAIGRNADPGDVDFINPDLTLLLHRDPVGEWLGSQAMSHWHPDGIGMSDALLFDERGVVGRALQTLVIR